ncbi:MAG TPA: VapE domain-containing protein [Terriglobia bacterium]|nr:VapE domain-containing protein [Terriglobia bacterium]
MDLSVADYAALESRWIDRPLADRAGLRRVDSLTGGEIIGRKGGNYSGIIIPYFRPGEGNVREYRLRRDQPDLEYDSAGNLKPRQKYLSPPGRSNMLYIVPGTDPSPLRNIALPIMITEGEFKTLALWRLANHRASAKPEFLPVGLSGVYNWRGTIGKTVGPDGSRLDVKGAIPDLDWITWQDRRVVIAYDTDSVTKDLVRIARSELAGHLRSRGAVVGFLEWDVARGKGIDDHLAILGPEAVLDEIAHVDFAGSAWKKDLLRAKPPMNTTEGRILPVLANAIAAFRHAPDWGGVLAFNEFGFGTVALKPAPWGIVPKGEWTDHEDRLAAEWLQKQGILVSVEIAGQAVQTTARDHPFHPVRTYLKGLRWDGVVRLDRWLSNYLGAEDTTYSRAVGSRWMISAVARIFRPGAKADCCLILEGPQGIRKSTALRTLAGDYFTDELADLGSKDAAMQTRGVWIIELSELDSLSSSDVARIKAFMSRTTDRFRPPYGMRLVESSRQCVFAGTVNHSTYLRDETGGRRFWPITCGRIAIDELACDRDQLWAEAKLRFDSGAPWWLETAELVQMASDQQIERYEGDPWEEVIAPWIEVQASVSISEVLEKCLQKPQGLWTQTDKNRAARCLRALGWERYRERHGSRLEWRYRKGE